MALEAIYKNQKSVLDKKTKSVPLGEQENSSINTPEKKPSLESYRIAELAAKEEISGEENNQTLKQYWVDLGNQLEIEGIPKEKICTVASKLIIEKKAENLKLPLEEIKPSGYFYRVYNDQGWTNQFYARNTNEKDEEPKKEPKPRKANLRYIDYLKRTKEICDTAIAKLDESEEIENTFSTKQIELLNHEWETVLQIAEDAFNEKTKVPLNTQQLLLLEAATASSITDAGRTFQRLKLEEYDKLGKFLTAKQIGKFQEGTIPESLSLFRPDSRDTAIFQKHYGLQCPKCHSWRVKERTDVKEDGSNLKCIDCEESFKGKTVSKCRYCQIPLYRESLQHIIKTGRCENCNTEIELPDELVQYARS